MRRFLQAWGRQEPSLLCPAEAASAPSLSSFHSSSSPCATILDESKLFSNIERQLSAKLTADTLLGQPSPPQQQQQLSPLHGLQQSPSSDSSLQSSHEISMASSVPSPPPSSSTNDLLAATEQQQQQQQQNAGIQPAAPAQKGLDAFFAALANANPANNTGDNSFNSSGPSQTSSDGGPLQSTMLAEALAQQPVAPTTLQQNSLASFIAATNDGTQMGQTNAQLVENIQTAANTAIANTLNAVTFMNAAIAVQQQQQAHQAQVVQQQQQQQSQASLLDTPSILASLKPSLLQQQQSSNDQLTAGNNALNALQMAQSAIQQQHQLGGPLSPENIVQAGIPGLLSRLGAPGSIARLSSSQSTKPIPLMEDKVDLLQFKKKEPREWSSDDVVAWILDVARRHQIACENINLAKFASCTGPLLMLMNEQSFKEHDQNYGSLLFGEFCKLVTDENFIDDWMRSTNSNMAGPSYQHMAPPPAPSNEHRQPMASNNPMANLLAANLGLQTLAPSQIRPGPSSVQQQPNLLLAAAAGIAAAAQQQQRRMPGLGQLLATPTVAPSESLFSLQPQTIHVPQPIASLSRMLQPGSSQQMGREGPSASRQMPGGMRAVRNSKLAEQKIRRNKDGRPRKRSQHTKGNKLWEFIRDALKDPRTCPSIVRWEDTSEGVFRIIESERLAFLWGQKKNNQKMTYEKLSRAMRTYYEKEILVPVPKSGLYPKKLVYKFGPSALGWKMAASLAVQSQLAMVGPQHQHLRQHM